MHIEVDKQRCMGAGQCALTAPEVFGSGDDGLVELLRATPADTQLEDAREAVDLCPAQAISLR